MGRSTSSTNRKKSDCSSHELVGLIFFGFHALFEFAGNFHFRSEDIMAYGTGEAPKMGDYVKNKSEQPGTVTAVIAAQAGRELVSIRWDNGRVEAPLKAAEEFALISRNGS
jgi:hypothetical protein